MEPPATCPDCGHQHATVCLRVVVNDPKTGAILCGCTGRGGGTCEKCGHEHRAVCLHILDLPNDVIDVCSCTRDAGQ